MAIAPWMQEEIRKKAEAGQTLDVATAEKQKLYDQYKNTMIQRIQQKAQNNIPLDVPTEYKMGIYNQYKPKPEPRPEFNWTPPTRPQVDYQQVARSEIDPLYNQAIQNINSQKHGDKLNAAEVASKRGLAHSGLAADLQNKVDINAASNISQLEAERAAKAAELMRVLQQRDQDLAYRDRQQAFSEWLSQNQLDMQRDQFDFSKEQDAYQRSRDSVEDARYKEQMAYQQARDAIEDERWKAQFDEDTKRWGLEFALQKQVQLGNLSVAKARESRIGSGGSSGGGSSSKSSSSKSSSLGGTGKSMSGPDSYNYGVSYWSNQIAQMKESGHFPGAYRIEQEIMQDPSTIKEITDNGYDINEFIDALYYASSNGQFKDKSAYEKYVAALDKQLAEKNKW